MPRKPSTHVDSAAAVGARLKEARARAGLSQRQLAFEGCTAAYISRIEAGARVPSLQVLREFGRRLGVSEEYLATGNETAFSVEETSLMHAELLARTGGVEEARRHYEAVLRDPQSPEFEAAALAGLGQISFRAGDHETAIGELSEALDSAALGVRDRAAAADSLGRAFVLTSRYEEAIALFERFLSDAKAHLDDAGIIRFSVLLANTLIDRTHFADAEQVLASIIDSVREAVDPIARAGLYWSQSRLHSSQNRADLAAHYARLALETIEVTEDTLYTAKALVLLAQLENERGNTREALDLFEQALPAISASGNAYEHGLLLIEKARALAALGEREEAAGTALGAVGLFRSSAPMSAGRGYAVAASIFRDLGEADRAAELYELAIEVLPVNDRHRVDALSALSEIFEAQGRKDDALELLKKALQAQIPAGLAADA